MPSIKKTQEPIDISNNRFTANYQNNYIIPIYSSVAIDYQYFDKKNTCLTCYLCSSTEERTFFIKNINFNEQNTLPQSIFTVT
jgi:hypothetical protein